MDQSERDEREARESHERAPDEPYRHGDPDDYGDTDEPCDHSATRIVNVYRERREVCNTCDTVLRTVIVP